MRRACGMQARQRLPACRHTARYAVKLCYVQQKEALWAPLQDC